MTALLGSRVLVVSKDSECPWWSVYLHGNHLLCIFNGVDTVKIT